MSSSVPLGAYALQAGSWLARKVHVSASGVRVYAENNK